MLIKIESTVHVGFVLEKLKQNNTKIPTKTDISNAQFLLNKYNECKNVYSFWNVQAFQKVQAS